MYGNAYPLPHRQTFTEDAVVWSKTYVSLADCSGYPFGKEGKENRQKMTIEKERVAGTRNDLSDGKSKMCVQRSI
jgi:hypothetical protein